MVLQKSKQLVNLQTLPTYCSTQWCSLFYPKNIVFTERVMTMRKKEAPRQKSLKTCLYFSEDLELTPCLMPEANQISGGWVCTQTKQGDRGGTDMYPGQRQGLSGV